MIGISGDVQKKVIAYLDEHLLATRKEICKSMPEHPENSVYRTIQNYVKEELIYDKQKSLFLPNRPKSQIPLLLKLNTEHPLYIKYKKGDSTK